MKRSVGVPGFLSRETAVENWEISSYIRYLLSVLSSTQYATDSAKQRCMLRGEYMCLE